MYKIVFTQRALKDLETIEMNTQQRIALKLKEYAEEPITLSMHEN
jgi:mRNA-degrading endonuclease RelE of RelBE toxin-antitoxin system